VIKLHQTLRSAYWLVSVSQLLLQPLLVACRLGSSSDPIIPYLMFRYVSRFVSIRLDLVPSRLPGLEVEVAGP
jgi:hypothetical protein